MTTDPGATVTSDEAEVEERTFQTEVQQILQILIHSLYTDKDVFLRELISNASDALDKIRFRSLTDRNIVDPDAELQIEINIDKNAGTLTIVDTGVGMTRDEVNENLGTIAHSGSAEFLKKLAVEEGENERLDLIGQFGVGFYSVFMVAERVVVTTRSAEIDAEAVMWESTGTGSYTISTTRDRAERGTQIVIFVRKECEDYLDAHRLESIIRRHSDYVAYPIKVAGKQGNEASAIWRRLRSEVSDEQYAEFYTHVTGDHQKPLAWEHIAVDVPIQFYAILYIPQQSPLEILFAPEPKVSLNLHVKRVFIQDDCNDVLPLYLRFVKGVVDCDDLPLNVARESLQNNPVITKIRQTLARRVLRALGELSKNKPADYHTFWTSFGMVLKEGVARDFENKDEVAGLLRYQTTLSLEQVDSDEKAGDDSLAAAGFISLQDYVDRMQSDQEVIYYLTGESREAIQKSPLLEAFRSRKLEVLYMTDPVDEWVINSLQEFDGKKLQAIDAEDVELKEEVKIEGAEEGEDKERTIELVSFLKKELESQVGDVRESQRLSDSPCVLVTPKGGLSQTMERLMKLSAEEFAPTKRILEINPRHPVIVNLGKLQAKERNSTELKEWAQFLVDYVLLQEGSIEEPQRMVDMLQKMMNVASERALES
jgi:molecular chaperone HtpG